MKQLLDRLQTPVATLDPAGRVLWANGAFGRAADIDGPGSELSDLFDAFIWDEIVERSASAPYRCTLARDGRLFSTVFTRHEDGLLIELLEHSNEEELPDLTQARRMISALEHSGETIVITDRNARIVYVNPQFERVMGYARKDVLGGHNSMWRSGVHDEAFYEAVWERLQRGETWRGELINRRRDGRLVHEATSISRVTDRAGDILGYVEIKRDVTAERELEQTLARAQRMDSIGTLAGGVAHDFNNVLQTILGNAELLLDATAEGAEAHRMITDIRTAAEQSAHLTGQLLTFARREVVTPRALDTNEEVGRITSLLRRLMGENIELRWEPAEGVWPIRVDPSQLSQVITNLCVNARDAIEDIGVIRVSVANIEAHESALLPITEDAHGEYVRLEIRDDGCGMDSDVIAHIFEPFYTNKPKGQGTGLGLSTVYGIVVQNGGHVFADSAQGCGTSMSIYLPRFEGVADAPRGEMVEPMAVARGARVLVVEDEPGILDVITQSLELAGHDVTGCGHPDAALKAMATLAPFDLLISDVIMPGMNGRDLARAIEKLQPGIDVLFMSGYTADALQHLSEEERARRFIQKPFRNRDLLARIEGILGRN